MKIVTRLGRCAYESASAEVREGLPAVCGHGSLFPDTKKASSPKLVYGKHAWLMLARMWTAWLVMKSTAREEPGPPLSLFFAGGITERDTHRAKHGKDTTLIDKEDRAAWRFLDCKGGSERPPKQTTCLRAGTWLLEVRV